LLVWSVIAELGGLVLAGAGAVLIIFVILNVGAGLVTGVSVLAGATAVFPRAEVLGADFSGATGVAYPGAAGAGSVRISGTSGPFPLSVPALLLLAPTSLAVSAPLALALVSGASC
jgi:hypothetical protein